MTQSIQKYTQCFAAHSTLKKSYFSLRDLMNTSIIVAIVLSSVASDCDDVMDGNQMNVFTLDKDRKAILCRELNLTANSLKKNLIELESHRVIEKLENDKYRMNPFIFARGTESTIKRCRIYCTENYQCPFEPLAESQKKFSFLFNNIENLKKFACFTGAYSSKRISKTELSVFLMLTAEAQSCKCYHSPEYCNIVELKSSNYKSLARTLGIDERSVRRAITSLADMHLLYKIPNINYTYMINPFVAAKGNIKLIRNLQYEMLNGKHNDLFNGCAQGDIEYYRRLSLGKNTK